MQDFFEDRVPGSSGSAPWGRGVVSGSGPHGCLWGPRQRTHGLLLDAEHYDTTLWGNQSTDHWKRGTSLRMTGD
uniref:Uncharacterized protein n=1 Tax=Magallana gigas TaxID=29159 RepID=K1QR15_MAGGI